MTDPAKQPFNTWWDDPKAKSGLGGFGQQGPAPSIQRENTYPGDLHKVLLRERTDGDFDAIDYFTRCGIGRYRFVPKVHLSVLTMQIVSIALVVLAYTYLVLHIGRAWGRHEVERAEAP